MFNSLMQKSESIKELAAALSKFQGAMDPIKKTAKNPFYKSNYANLASIIDGCAEELAANGLAIAQFPTGQNGLSSILMHTSGEWIENTVTMPTTDNKPQSVGSALTYFSRYARVAILGLATEDDDGIAASTKSVTRGDIAPFDEPPIGEPTYHPMDEKPFCPAHQKELKKNNYGYYCGTKLPDGTWCKSK